MHASVVRSRNCGRLAKRYHNHGVSVPIRALSTKILSRYRYWYRALEQCSMALRDCFATTGSRCRSPAWRPKHPLEIASRVHCHKPNNDLQLKGVEGRAKSLKMSRKKRERPHGSGVTSNVEVCATY